MAFILPYSLPPILPQQTNVKSVPNRVCGEKSYIINKIGLPVKRTFVFPSKSEKTIELKTKKWPL